MIKLLVILIIGMSNIYLNSSVLFAGLSKQETVNGGAMSITDKEAIVIAQRFMKEKGLEKDWNLKKPKVYFSDEKEIGVKFYTKHPFSLNLKYALPYLIVVRRNDGQISAWGQSK